MRTRARSVDHDDVEMDVQIERAIEAMDERDAAEARFHDAPSECASRVDAFDLLRDDLQDLAHRIGSGRENHAQFERHGDDPLPERSIREHVEGTLSDQDLRIVSLAEKRGCAIVLGLDKVDMLDAAAEKKAAECRVIGSRSRRGSPQSLALPHTLAGATEIESRRAEMQSQRAASPFEGHRRLAARGVVYADRLGPSRGASEKVDTLTRDTR
jgi:hypothetical protein